MTSVQPPRKCSALETYFFALTLFISLISLAAVALLSVESFTPWMVLSGASAALLISALFLARYRPSHGLSLPEWGVVALVLLAFALRWNTAIYIYGGQDPGVYTNVASHFAEHGSWIIKDHLLDEFEGRKDLREYYVANSLRRAVQNDQGGWYGNMLPGVYLKDLDKNEWVSQFYHVNTTWLAIGQWMFGIEWKGLTLAFLSSLSIIAAYLIAARVSASPGAGLAAAFLLATNAAHSYIGTFPVSEAAAGFFFLSALALLTAGWQLLSILPFSALFLTRITGFLTTPLLLLALAWIVVKRKDTRAAWTGLGILWAYGLSLLWGLTFSGPYSRDIYRGKLGIPPYLLEHAPSLFIVAGSVWLIGCFLALRYRKALKPLCIGLLRHRTQLIIGLIILILAAVVYRGYLLAFTDHYAQHRWFGKRWDMAGHGIESLRYLSFYSLTMMLSPLGLLAFLPGLGYIGRIGIRRANFAPLAVCALGFFAALTIKQLTTPYLYYFGRYLVSELLPLAIVCAAIGIHALARYLPQFKAIAIILYCGCVFTLLYPSLHARLRIREGRQFFEAMSCIDQATPGRSVIFIDKKSFAETPVVTALRLSFQKPTFALRETDFGPPEKLQSLIDYFREKGFAVHLLSSGEAWNAKGGFNKIMRIPAIMRKIGGRAEPPTKMNTLSHPIRLYSLEKPAKLPDICQKVMGYSR